MNSGLYSQFVADHEKSNEHQEVRKEEKKVWFADCFKKATDRAKDMTGYILY